MPKKSKTAMSNANATATITITAAAHKKLKRHCARTGEKMGVAGTRAVVEYVRKK